MGISSDQNRRTYSGDGSSAVFNYPYEFHDDAGISVLVYNSSRTTITAAQALTTNYTLSGTKDLQGRYLNGANVVFNSSPATGDEISIFGSTAVTSAYALGFNEHISRPDLVKALDRLVLINQRLNNQVTRSVRLQDSYPYTFDTSLPERLTPGAPIIVSSSGVGFNVGLITNSSGFAGVFPLAQGGLGASLIASSGMMLYAVSATEMGLTGRGGADQVVIQQSSYVPIFGAVNLASGSSSTGVLASNRGGTSHSSFVSASLVYASSTSVLSFIANGGTDQPLVGNNGAAPSYQPLNLASGSSVTGVLAVSRGGTGSGTALNNARIIVSSSGTIAEATAITASRALVSNVDGIPVAATTTSTEIGYVNGVTSAIQTQINARVEKATLTAKGSIYGASAASTPAELAVGSNDMVLTAASGETTGLKWANAASLAGAPTSPGEITNVGIAASVASSSLTIALKQADGSTDPASGTGACKIGFRSSSVTSGAYAQLSITGALSIVISSGSTLGSTSGDVNWVYVYAIDNAGTAELAVSGHRLADEGSLHTTTDDAGNADSKYLLYSADARSNVAVRLIGRVKSTQAVAGVWETSPSEVSLAPFENEKVLNNHIWLTTGNGLGGSSSGETTVRNFATVMQNAGTAITYAARTATTGDKFTINEDGIYAINYNDRDASAGITFGLTLNSTGLSTVIQSLTSAIIISMTHVQIANRDTHISWVGPLFAGDIIRAQFETGGTPGTTFESRILLTKVR